jgi:hypothetical protein
MCIKADCVLLGGMVCVLIKLSVVYVILTDL